MVAGMKDCLIIGNKNAVTTKYVFPLLKDGVLKTGYTVPKDYTQPEWCETKSLNGLTRWFSTLPVEKKTLTLTSTYDPDKYPKYDNYDAIEVSRVENIPMDYDGVMGVPITFFDKYCPTQFEIVGMAAGNSAVNNFGASAGYKKHVNDRGGCGVINGKPTYARICIRRKVQFEIVGLMSGARGEGLINGNDGRVKFYVNGKGVYARILIRKIK